MNTKKLHYGEVKCQRNFQRLKNNEKICASTVFQIEKQIRELCNY